MEDVGDVFCEDAGGEFYFEEGASEIESYDEESGSCGDGRSLGIELLEVLLGPLVYSVRVYSWLGLQPRVLFSFLFLHF